MIGFLRKVHCSRIFLGLIWVVTAAGSGFGQPAATATDSTSLVLRQVGWDITGQECIGYVSKLAGEDFAGRGTGSKYFRKAAEYIAHQFRQMSLQPGVGDTSFYQRYRIGRNFLQTPIRLAMEIPVPRDTGYDTLWMDFSLEDDFMPAGTAASWDTLTDVIFTGYGINAPGKGWNDYADIDVRDKLVMVLGGTPDLEDVSFAGFAGTRDKFCMAEEAGAAGVLAIGHSVGTISSKQTLPAFRISSETANALLKGTGYSVDSLKHAMKAENHPITLHLKHRLRVQVTSTFQPDQATMNIVGVLPGSDPALQDQHLVLGAHADHLGRIAGHSFYGANDNGSGTATVLAVAKAFSELDTAPLNHLHTFFG